MMTNRELAQLRGRIKYQPEKPCRRGHMCERYTAQGSCVMCNDMWCAKRDDKRRNKS